MVERSVIDSVKAYLTVLEERGTPVLFGVVYGSQANGTSQEESDIDLVVVSPNYDGEYTREDVHHLWHLAGELDERIEPIPCGEIEWREDDSNLIIDAARREGVIVKVSESASPTVDILVQEKP